MSTPASTAILTALTRLMTQWSSPRVQSQYAEAAGVNIDSGDIAIVYTLGMQGNLRSSALADRLRLTRPTMSKQLHRLESTGLIVRRPDPEDGRASFIDLSEAGRAAYGALVSRGIAAIETAIGDWSPDDREHFAELARRFVTSVGVDIPDTSQKEE